MSDLFRKEAVDFATRGVMGDVVLALPLSNRLLSLLALGVVAAGFAFLATATYARKETVAGYLIPADGVVRIAARQGGVVDKVLVSEGEQVRVGQPLVRLRLSSDLERGDSFSRMAEALRAKSDASRLRGVASRQSLLAERDQLVQRQVLVQKQISESRARLALQKQRVELAKSQVASVEDLAASGYFPKREVENRRSTLLALEQQESDLRAAELDLERQKNDIRARLQSIPLDLEAASADQLSAAAGISQEETQSEASSTYVVVASKAGRIAAFTARAGKSLPPDGAIGMIAADGKLVAELYANSRSVGFIQPGQEVRIKYQAFPYQKFGTGLGRVRSVSRTAMSPSDIDVPGVVGQEALYRVSVDLSSQNIRVYGREQLLRPGMQVFADVIADRRSLFEWLLDPLYAAGRLK
ncbi:HlyD family secretion protein [Caulobacter segnis]